MTLIQVFNRYLQPGGEENSVKRIARHLELGGHRVERFWRGSDEWQGPKAPPRWKQPLLLFNNPSVLRELRALHLSVRADAWILHNILPVVSLGVYRLARELGVPVIQWLHNYRPISPSGALGIRGKTMDPADPWLMAKEILAGTWRGRLSTALVSAGYLRARWRGDFASVAAWVAVSDEMRSLFLRAGWPADRLFTLRHAWDAGPDNAHPSPGDHFLFLGRLLEIKGVPFLADLWRDPELSSLPLVLAGEGPLKDQLAGRSPESWQWPGYVVGEAKTRLVEGARAILFPCLWPEPLSTVAYEAYDRRRPILASDLGGMREIVFDRKTGRTLPPSDPGAWKSAILEAWQNRELSTEWGANGRRWLDMNVSPDAWNNAFSAMMENLRRAGGNC